MRQAIDLARSAKVRGGRFGSDETGSLIIFSLFIFVLILFIAGMAVDAMRHETRRVAMQNTLDSAILAASSLGQDINATTLVKEFVEKAGFDPDSVNVVAVDQFSDDGNNLVGRRVSANTTVTVDTMFMDMMGVSSLNAPASGTAYEAVQNIEISLIVDISGSMGDNSRLVNLKVAAKEFVDLVLTNNPNANRTSISIVPYNATVVVGSSLLSRLNAGGTTGVVDPVSVYNGALVTYPTEHNDSTCVRFEDDDFNARVIDANTVLRRVSHFDEGGNSYAQPTMSQRWCDETRSAILPLSNDPVALKAHIEGLKSGGWTGIDNGLKWGVALLDPAIAPVITAMVDNNELSENVRNRPGAYDNQKTMKFVVLMTDGANTVQRDLKDEYKKGPSRVWYSDASTTGYDNALGRNRTKFDGYFVEMPDNAADRRWYVPGSPNTQKDDYYTTTTALPADAVQLHYHQLHSRFSVSDIAKFFFQRSDTAAYNAHNAAVYQTEGYGSVDDRLEDMCDAAKQDDRMKIFAIGFEAPAEGLAAMRNCATSLGYYYDVQGTQISDAFKSIAGQITMLRLTE
jgi:Putative Flp pilus-assembly TadE/G-like